MSARGFAAVCGFALAAACGGRVSHERAASTEGGAAGAAGIGDGASDAVGAAGSASGASGTAGASGMSGSAGAACASSAAPVPCQLDVAGFYYDAANARCSELALGACPSSDNHFDSLAACEATCHPEMFECERANDCQIGSLQCCGYSCLGPLDLSAHIAVSRRLSSAQSSEACPYPHYCGPGEPSPADPLAFTCQYLLPSCDAGRCRVVDLRDTPLVACTADSDCFLRVSSSCCPGACDQPSIAINSESALREIVCAGEQACGAMCPPSAELRAACVQGRCTVLHASQ